jgi:hypothetical protein
MSRRDALLTEWRTRLAECERQLAGDPGTLPSRQSRWTWLRQMQARLLRFLIAQYGREGAWQSFADDDVLLPMDAADHSAATGSAVAASAAEWSGAPPKSADRIRATLDTIHARNQGGMPAGPLRDGLPDDCPVVLASFRRREMGAYFCRHLRHQGIDCDYRSYRGTATVFVARGNLERAHETLAGYVERMKRGPSHAIGYLSYPVEPIRPPRASVWAVAAATFVVAAIAYFSPPGLPRDVAWIVTLGLALSGPIIHAIEFGARAHDKAKGRPLDPPTQPHDRRE